MKINNWIKNEQPQCLRIRPPPQVHSPSLIGHILQESAVFFTGSISTNKIVEYAERQEGASLLFFYWHKCLAIESSPKMSSKFAISFRFPSKIPPKPVCYSRSDSSNRKTILLTDCHLLMNYHNKWLQIDEYLLLSIAEQLVRVIVTAGRMPERKSRSIEKTLDYLSCCSPDKM